MSENEKKKLLEIKDLKIYYPIKGKRDAEGKPAYVKAVDGVTFDVYENETFGLVGESGCGKSTTGRTVVRLNKPTAGSVTFEGHDLFAKMNRQQNMDLTQKIQIIYQDPYSSLDPRFTVGRCIEEPLIVHHMGNKEERRARVLQLMHDVGLREEVYTRYPHEFSGGMRQRVVIAIALACDPDLLICDEPTTALDVTIQAKILELIRSIQRERGISVIYITHDLGVVAKVADYVDVMYAGKIVETGTIDEIFYEPRHPYTWGLLSAMPDLDTADDRLYTIPGSPPNLLHEKQGDAFAPRNHFALNIDDEVDPPMFKISDTHYAATWLLDPRAPKVDMPPELAQRIARMRAEAEKIKEAE